MATRKTTAKNAPAGKTASAQPAATRLTVRMYRQGLGDCFLVSLARASSVVNGTTYYYVTTAVDGTGAESSYSNEAVAVIP